jgi:hypothetical protein
MTTHQSICYCSNPCSAMASRVRCQSAISTCSARRITANLAPRAGCKSEQIRSTVCLHRGLPRIARKSLSQNHFLSFAAPIHSGWVRYQVGTASTRRRRDAG